MTHQIPTIGVMPALGLGTWRLAGRECEKTVRTALDLGYRHFDTADVYGNHADVGDAIAGFPREKLFLVSKIISGDLAPKQVLKACQRILKELKTPYLDLLLIHWPSDEIEARVTLEAMYQLQEQQLIRHLGVSNFMISHLEKLENLHLPILTNQIELHPFLQEKALTKYCQSKNIIVTAYRPIQKGEVAEEKVLKEIGEHHRKTPIQVTLRWLYQRNIVSIPKATSKEHLRENLAIFDFALTPQEMQRIETLDSGRRYVTG